MLTRGNADSLSSPSLVTARLLRRGGCSGEVFFSGEDRCVNGEDEGGTVMGAAQSVVARVKKMIAIYGGAAGWFEVAGAEARRWRCGGAAHEVWWLPAFQVVLQNRGNGDSRWLLLFVISGKLWRCEARWRCAGCCRDGEAAMEMRSLA